MRNSDVLVRVLADVGVFDDVQAATAWRDAAGGSAETVEPEALTDPDQLSAWSSSTRQVRAAFVVTSRDR